MTSIKIQLLEMTLPKFKSTLEELELDYTKLSSLRNFFIKEYENEPRNRLKSKIRFVEKIMKAKIDNGLSRKRRKSGSGKKIVTEHVYKDNAVNRQHNRVGQTYHKVHYEDAEYEEVPYKRFKKYRPSSDKASVDKPKRKSIWTEAVKLAKEKINAPKMTLVRKEVKDPNDPRQVEGHKLYLEALEQMKILKQQQNLSKENEQLVSSS